MPKQLSRRSVMLTGLTGAAGIAATGALAGENETAIPFFDEPSALLAEHRLRAARFFALEAHFRHLDDIAYQVVVGSFPPDYVAETAEEVNAAFADYDRNREPRERLLIVAKSHVADIDRRLWDIPAETWDDIVARAELAEFWNRGWGFHDHHGYEDSFADRRLADAVLIDQPSRPSRFAFEPPPQLLDYRRLQQAWWVDAWRQRRGEEHLDFFDTTLAIEQALLKAVTPARSWSDIVVRAELTQYHRRDMLHTWANIDTTAFRKRGDWRLLNHRSYAELFTSILALGDVPRPPKLPYEDDLPANLPELFEDDEEV